MGAGRGVDGRGKGLGGDLRWEGWRWEGRAVGMEGVGEERVWEGKRGKGNCCGMEGAYRKGWKLHGYLKPKGSKGKDLRTAIEQKAREHI